MYINNLITGTMTLGSGGSAPVARTATRVWYGNDENVYTDYDRIVVTDFDDEYIYVDGKALLERNPKAASEDGWFYFAVGGYYKIPGIGGGGGWGEIDAKEIHEGTIKIPNHTDIDIWNRIIMWL